MATTKAATTKPQSYQWDPRGVCLISLTASWQAVAPFATWRGLLRQLGMNESQGTTLVSVVTGLPDPPLLGKQVVAVSVVASGATEQANEDVEAHWTLETYLAPDSTAPASISRVSSHVGGYKGLLGSLHQHWPNGEPQRFSISSSYMVDGGKSTPSAPIRRNRPKIIRSGSGIKMRPMATIWVAEREDERDIITTGYPNSTDPFPLGWVGAIERPLTADIVSDLDAAVWEQLRTVVAEKTRRHRAGGG
jgi:hypothetical protein